MWVWSVRSSPSVRQRRRDRSRIHRSLWPSHPASAYPRCLCITQQDRERLTKKVNRERERQSEAKATQSYQSYMVLAPYREQGELGGERAAPQRQVPPITTTTTTPPQEGRGEEDECPVEEVEGHWSHKLMVGTQTHTSTADSSLTESVRSVRQFGSSSRWETGGTK